MSTESSSNHRKMATELFLNSYSFVRKIAFGAAPCRELTNDIVNDVFIRFVKNAEHWDYSVPMRPLLRKMTQNVALEYWQRHIREMNALDKAIAEWVRNATYQTTDTFPGFDLEDELQELKHCISGLLPEQQQLIEEHYFQGCSFSELARRHQQKENTVHQRASRIRAILRRCVEKALSLRKMSEKNDPPTI